MRASVPTTRPPSAVSHWLWSERNRFAAMFPLGSSPRPTRAGFEFFFCSRTPSPDTTVNANFNEAKESARLCVNVRSITCSLVYVKRFLLCVRRVRAVCHDAESDPNASMIVRHIRRSPSTGSENTTTDSVGSPKSSCRCMGRISQRWEKSNRSHARKTGMCPPLSAPEVAERYTARSGKRHE